jgi:hypothetical protein
MNVLGLISQLIIIETLRLTESISFPASKMSSTYNDKIRMLLLDRLRYTQWSSLIISKPKEVMES